MSSASATLICNITISFSAAASESCNLEIKSSLSSVSAWRVSISTSMSSSRAVTSSGFSHDVSDAGLPSEKVMASGRNDDDGDLLLFRDGSGACDISVGTLRLFISWECSCPVAGVKVNSSSSNRVPERLVESSLSWDWSMSRSGFLFGGVAANPIGARTESSMATHIMAASAIAISFDSLDGSVGSPPSRVILFDDIPTVIPSTSVVALETSTIAPVISYATPVVETTLVASPTRLCGLVPYSGSDSDSQDEMSSPEHISPLPAISAFLCIDSSEAPDSSDRPPSQDPYVATAFRHWCAAPLSTLYPPTTSDSSIGDSSERPLHSSSHSAGPSRKRCISPVDSVPSSTLVIGSLAPTRADLLPPRKRFRDSYSSETIIEEDTEIDPIGTRVDMELGIGDGADVRDHIEIDPRDVRDDTKEYEADTSAGDTVEVGIDPMSAPIVEEEIIEPAGEDSFDSSGTRDGIVRSFKDMPIDLDDVVRDFYHHMSKVRIDRIVGIGTA
ncbi:hypothetical protein Tco_0453675 [Tanacetum coccineum]